MSGKVLLIDGNSLLHRAYHALPPLVNTRGEHTHAVYGLANMLLRLLEAESPHYVAVAMDKGRVTFRHRQFALYKATRPETPEDLQEQFPLARELLAALSIPLFELEDYEADDILGTLARCARQRGLPVVVVSGDQDVLQLVGPGLEVLLTRKGITDLRRMDEAAVEEQYGIKPGQVADYKALVGDPSDNIPGVPGIGPKTAVQLLADFPSVEELLQGLEEVHPARRREQLEQHQDVARLSKDLATIYCDVPLEVKWQDCRRWTPRTELLRPLLERLEFRSLQARLGLESGGAEEEDGALEVCTASSLEALEHLAQQCQDQGLVAVAPVCSESHPRRARLLGCAFALPSGETWYAQGDMLEAALFGEPEHPLAGVLASDRVEKVMHGGKLGYHLFCRQGRVLRGLGFDTRVAGYLCHPEGGHTLEQLNSTYGEGTVPGWRQLMENSKKGATPEALSQEKMQAFAGRRGQALLLLRDRLEQRLRDLGLEQLFQEVELPLVQVLARMEKRGVALSGDTLEIIGAELDERILALQKDIFDQAGEEFNLNSPRQLSVILFEKLRLPVIKKTKTGYSTDAEVLEKLASEHQVVERILEYRQLVKLRGTYVDGLLNLREPDTGKVHTTFKQTVAATGRLSSAEPNLQNIPIRLEVGRRLRKAFLPGRPDAVLLAGDYSQIELRVLAHITGDPFLLESFQAGQDVHTRTAAEVFGVAPDQVTSTLRNRAKAVNFGIVYGISDYGLARDLGVARDEARTYIDNYLDRYRGVKEYMQRQVERARDDGYVTTLFGRRRFLPDINSRNSPVRAMSERMAINTPIQGTAADIIKKAMVDVETSLQDDWESRLVLQVHDELILEVPQPELEEVSQLVSSCMSRAARLSVPLEVEIKAGPNWYQMKTLD